MRHTALLIARRGTRPTRAWLQEDKIAVLVATVTDDVRLFEVPALKVCALRFTETARARIIKVRPHPSPLAACLVTFRPLCVRAIGARPLPSAQRCSAQTPRVCHVVPASPQSARKRYAWRCCADRAQL